MLSKMMDLCSEFRKRKCLVGFNTCFPVDELKYVQKYVEGATMHRMVRRISDRSPSQDRSKLDFKMKTKQYASWLRSHAPSLYYTTRKLENDICNATGIPRLTVNYHVLKTASSIHSQPQALHMDNPENRGGYYFTALIPLSDDNAEVTRNDQKTGTRFCKPFLVAENDGTTKMCHRYHCVNIYGGMVVFDGHVLHCGLANKTGKERLCLFLVLFSGRDPNEDW
jgi:hypothetical protein